MRKISRVAVVIFYTCVAVALLTVGGLLMFLELTKYSPLPVESVVVKNESLLPLIHKNELSFFTWNIGYAGMGKDMDFFYEGGTMVRPDRKTFQKYLEGIKSVIRANDSADFILLQEVDTFSRRSYFVNEGNEISKIMGESGFGYAENYNCRLVPVPVMNPVGRVTSGLVTITGFRPMLAQRWDYGTRFSWPKQMVMLKRCFLVMMFDLENSRKLVVINTHNSVFDEGGRMRETEIRLLFSFALDEYRKGNHVIIGGDWNMNPKGFNRNTISTGDKTRDYDFTVGQEYLPGWTFAFDPSRPTNREVNRPYVKGKTATTIIDFFVLSPGIELTEVKTLDTGFEYSDHQPVFLKVNLRE